MCPSRFRTLWVTSKLFVLLAEENDGDLWDVDMLQLFRTINRVDGKTHRYAFIKCMDDAYLINIVRYTVWLLVYFGALMIK